MRAETPCARCGWKWRGFHICVDPSTPEPKQKQTIKRRHISDRSDSHREALSESNEARWRRINFERDAALVDRYKDGDVGFRGLAKEFNLSYKTVALAMKKAQERGEVEIRPAHRNKLQPNPNN